MYPSGASDAYIHALRMGQKEHKELTAAGMNPYPAVLDELLENTSDYTIRDLPVQEIPIERIIGTKSAGRISAFSAGFLPLLEASSEFATKWTSLCADHLSDVGIRQPILCYEYLGDFYVQEGNKRVSVLKYFGAARIPSMIKRVMPQESDEPRIKAYYEFLDFYKVSKLYDVQFHRPGSYAKLLALMGKEPGEEWTEWERRSFSSRYHYFKEAFADLVGKQKGPRPEEALLLWLQVYSYSQLTEMGPKELKKSLSVLWEDVLAGAGKEPVKLHTAPAEENKGIIEKIITPAPSHLNIAMIYQGDTETSHWAMGHEQGAQYLEQTMGDKVTVRRYFHADTPEQVEAALDQAAEEGAEMVFATTPHLLQATLKAAVKYPKMRFLNCSTDTPLSSVRSYYCRIYEGKFITGAIAGAMAENDLVGYVGTYPILGVPAAINAFALGAQMTNPRAKILLEWSCLPGDAVENLRRRGARVISSRDVPLRDMHYMEQGEYGTFMTGEDGSLVPLASPCWIWGKLYENIVRSVFAGTYPQKKNAPGAVNYWWGMDSGAVDVDVAGQVPESLRAMAGLLMRDIRDGRLDPFHRMILAQDGSEKNDGSRNFSPEEILHMDWLCENVEGRIPAFEDVLPVSQALVRELGIHRDQAPPEKKEKP